MRFIRPSGCLRGQPGFRPDRGRLVKAFGAASADSPIRLPRGSRMNHFESGLILIRVAKSQ